MMRLEYLDKEEKEFVTCNSFLELIFLRRWDVQNIFESRDAEFIGKWKKTISSCPKSSHIMLQVNLCNICSNWHMSLWGSAYWLCQAFGLWALTGLNLHAVLWEIIKMGGEWAQSAFFWTASAGCIPTDRMDHWFS